MMSDEGLRETVFVAVSEVMARPLEAFGHTAFTFPAGTTIHGFSVGLDGLLEVDATFPAPAVEG